MNSHITSIDQLQIGRLYMFKMDGSPLPAESMRVFWIDFTVSPFEELLVYLGSRGTVISFLDSTGMIRYMSMFGLQNHGEVGIRLYKASY
jgi:hypothetical protein